MDSIFKNYKKHNNGFTLVELIVVLVVIAILAAIMIPAMTGWIDESNQRKLSVACHTCVTAAATIAAEDYAESEDGALLVPPTDAEIRELAGIDTGSVVLVSISQRSGRRIGSNVYSKSDYPPGTVEYLTYTDDEGHYATYVLGAADGSSSTRIVFSDPLHWSKGTEFTQGEIMQGIPVGAETRSDGSANILLLRCLKTHKSGSRSNTRDPTVKSNKGSWEVVGTIDGKPAAYSPTVRFGIGCVVEYKNNLYYRTDFNLTGGQTPYSKSSSMYWTLIGPNPNAPSTSP